MRLLLFLGDACARTGARGVPTFTFSIGNAGAAVCGASPVHQHYVTVSELEYRENQTRLCLP